MHRLLALVALLTTNLTPVTALHCERAAAPATVAPAAPAHAGHADVGQAHDAEAHAGRARTGHERHHAAPAPGHAPDAPDPHADCRLVMACGMSMLRSTEPTTARAPLPEAARPVRTTALALTVAPAPADPPPPRRPI